MLKKFNVFLNGSQFRSKEFKMFSNEYDFKHSTSSPTFPQSNGLAESCVKIVKNLLKKSKNDGSDFNLNLLVYRSSPLDFGKSPAELMFGRKIRSNLPMVQKISKRNSVVLKQKDAKKQKQKCQFDKKAVELPPLKAGD